MINFVISIICYIWVCFNCKFYKDMNLWRDLTNLCYISDFDISIFVLNEFYCIEKGGWGEDGASAWNEVVGGIVCIPAVSSVLERCGGVNRCMTRQLQMFSCKCLSYDFSVSKAFELWFI